MRGRQARSEACLLTLGLALPDLASGEAACLRCPGLWAMSLSLRCSCAVIRLLVPRWRLVLSMLEMLGLLDPEIGLRCWISRFTWKIRNSNCESCELFKYKTSLFSLLLLTFLTDQCTFVHLFENNKSTHLTLYDLFSSKVYKCHLYRLAFDPVHPAVTDWADHDEEEGHPGHRVRAVLAWEGLVEDLELCRTLIRLWRMFGKYEDNYDNVQES